MRAAGCRPAMYSVTSKKYQTSNSLRIFNPSEFVGTKKKCRTLPQNGLFGGVSGGCFVLFFATIFSLDRNQSD